MTQTKQVALITGASSGIGYQIALEWGRNMGTQGHLVVVGRNEKHLDNLVAELHNYGATTTILLGDLADLSFVDDIMAYINRFLYRIDTFFACAGYGDFRPTLTYSADEIAHLMQINLISTIYLTQEVAKQMIQQGHGHICLIASMAGKLSTINSAIYSASKAGLIAYANGLRLDLAKANIKVVTVNPGPVDTPFFDKSSGGRAYFNRVAVFALQPDWLARKIVTNTLKRSRPFREINQPRIMSLAHIIYTVVPDIADWVNRYLFHFK